MYVWPISFYFIVFIIADIFIMSDFYRINEIHVFLII